MKTFIFLQLILMKGIQAADCNQLKSNGWIVFTDDNSGPKCYDVE